MKTAFYITSTLALACLPVLAVTGIKPDGTLDRNTLHALYFNGEFKPAIEALEIYSKEAAYPTEEERIFVCKYLGVMYSADTATRDKGENYFYQLIKLKPDVMLYDMMVSDVIDSILNKVRIEYHQQQANFQRELEKRQARWRMENAPVAAAEGPGRDGKSSGRESGRRSLAWLGWTAGGLAVAGAVTVFLLASGDDKKEKRIKVGEADPEM